MILYEEIFNNYYHSHDCDDIENCIDIMIRDLLMYIIFD
jgi:hypothetical protein